MKAKITLLFVTCIALSCTEMIAKKKCVKSCNLRIYNKAMVGALTARRISLCPPAAVGTVGVPGLGGALAYGAVGDTGAQTVANGAPLTFNLLSVVPGARVVQTSSGLTVLDAGIYRIQVLIAGEATGAGQTFVFDLQNNGVSVANSAVASNTSAGAGILNVIGFGLLPLAANSSLTLVNISGGSVTLFPGGTNAVFTIERIA